MRRMRQDLHIRDWSENVTKQTDDTHESPEGEELRRQVRDECLDFLREMQERNEEAEHIDNMILCLRADSGASDPTGES